MPETAATHAWGYGLATVRLADGEVLDTWFPSPALGTLPEGRDPHIVPAEIEHLEAEDARRGVRMEARTVEIIATAAVRRGYLGRAWLQPFLQAARHPAPEPLIARLAGDAPAPTPRAQAQPGGTVSFLFTDIEASTTLWEQHPVGMQRALARHDSILRQAIAGNDGHVFKTAGDAFCAAFGTAAGALSAA